MSTQQPQCGCLFIGRDDPAARRLGLGAVALRYAAMGPGFQVLPLVPGTKRPATEHGVLDATTGQRLLREQYLRDPRRGVGIRNGLPGGALFADTDVKRGIDGPAVWAAFLAGIGVPPSPVWDTSPSGGYRMVWRLQDRGLHCRNGVLPAVDIPGYAAVWPTGIRQPLLRRPGERRPGRPEDRCVYLTYEWNGCPCSAPPAPGALLDAIEALPGGHASGGGHGGGDGAHGGASPLPATGELAANGIPDGMPHDDTLARLVLRLAGRNMPEQMIFRIWGEVVANTPTAPGWPFTGDDFRRHLKSARRKAAANQERNRAVRDQWLAWTAGSRS